MSGGLRGASVPSIAREQITGVVLAGGRGSRMGGVDKGLQLFQGVALARHALDRLRPQVGPTLVVANRNLPAYRDFGAPVLSDDLPDHAGPLAGFLVALDHCATPWLLTVPCDAPCFPQDLASRLAEAVVAGGGTAAVATDGARPQPVFCLLHRSLRNDLRDFLRRGERKIGAWLSGQAALRVPFGPPEAFVNINSLEALRALEAQQAPPPEQGAGFQGKRPPAQ